MSRQSLSFSSGPSYSRQERVIRLFRNPWSSCRLVGKFLSSIVFSGFKATEESKSMVVHGGMVSKRV